MGGDENCHKLVVECFEAAGLKVWDIIHLHGNDRQVFKQIHLLIK